MINDFKYIDENKIFNISDDLNLTYLSNEKCLSLSKTNVRISGNQKLIHKNDNELYLESINSSDYLNRSFFKGYKIDVNQGYLFNLKQFLSQSSNSESIHEVKIEEQTIAKEFSSQYVNLYKWGAYTEQNDTLKNDTKNNSYRFFAPLWTYGKLPDRFLIFRIVNDELSTLEDYFKYNKLIHSVDLKSSTVFGSYLRTLTEHKSFKDSSIYINYDDSTIRYYGIDYETGTFKYQNESNLDSYLANERTISEFNNSLSNGWKRNNLICANLLNLEYVFSDDEVTNTGFNNYVGIYVYDNEISQLEANRLEKESRCIILSECEKNVIQYKTINNKRKELLPYQKTIKINNALQYEKINLNPIAEITLPYYPILGSTINIIYNDIVELQINIDSSIYNSSSTTEILYKISEIINNTNTTNIIITSVVENDTLIIKSEINDKEYENIKIELPHIFEMKRDVYYNELKYKNSEIEHTFNNVNDNDIFINDITFADADVVEIDNIEYKLIKSFEYRNNKVIRLGDGFENVNIKNSIIKIKKLTYPKYYIASICKFVNFDDNMNNSIYYDIWDYDMLQHQINFANNIKHIFKKEYDGTITIEEKEIIDAYRSFFKFKKNADLYNVINDNIIIIENKDLEKLNSKEVLIKSLNNISKLPNETIKNEFQRLNEDTLLNTRNINILEPLILKFVNTNGKDSYNNPISLNIDLSRRYDNFQYLNESFNRSNYNHTHQWFILGAGPGTYNKEKQDFDIYLNNINKQLGYANIPVINDKYHHSITLNQFNDKFDLCNTETDVYKYISYRLSEDKESFYYKHGYINMFHQDGTDNYNAIFRGVEYSLTGNFKDYRFSVIMINELSFNKSKSITNPYTLVDNKEFKTLTLVINFPIQDKYITSLNNKMPYYLDRSFLYYTNKFYNTSSLNNLNTNEDFEIIEINLFDVDTLHFYKDKLIQREELVEWNRENEQSNKTRKVNSWYTFDENNNPIFSIKMGLNSEKAGYKFTDLLSISEDKDIPTVFEWITVSSISDNNIMILIRYTAYDIIEVKDNEIWCRDIYMEFIPTSIKLYKDNSYSSMQFIELTLEDIILNNSNTITINNHTYDIPFFNKIKSSTFCDLLLSDSKGVRKGLRLTKEFYEQIDLNKFIYDDSILNSKYIKTNSNNQKFICFDSVVFDKDKKKEKDLRLNLNNKNGYFMEHDQFWYISKDLCLNNSSFINHTTKHIISNIDKFSIANANLIFDIYPIKTIIVDENNIFETTTKINILPLSETFIILSLFNDNKNELQHSKNLLSYEIKRQNGNYNPLFNCILQPYTFRKKPFIINISNIDIDDKFIFEKNVLYWNKNILMEYDFKEKELIQSEIKIYEIDNFDLIEQQLNIKFLGQLIFNKSNQKLYIYHKSINNVDLIEIDELSEQEFIDCMIPKKLNEYYSGRRIATTDDNFKNYCELYKDNGLNHINQKYFYKAVYEGKEFDVLSDACLTEQRNFISSVYNNSKRKVFNINVIDDNINLIDITINEFGFLFKKYLNKNNINYIDMLNIMKLYNKDLNKDNIIFEDFFYEMYKHHYEEFLCKYYKVTEITTSKNEKVEFNYDGFSNIKIDSSKLDSKKLKIIIQKI